MFWVSSLNMLRGSPRVEAYAVEDLAARAEAVGAGLGVLVAELVSLAGEVAGPGLAAGSFDEIEQRVCMRGRELLRMVMQHAMDVQAAAERRLPGVIDAAGVARTRAERGHARTVVSSAGPVVVRRVAYRAAGAANLHPRDAVLNLPVRRYSQAVQAMAAGFALEASFGQASQWLAARIGTAVAQRQIEQIVAEAARDCEGFYATRAPVAAGREIPLVLSADGKGVAMRPEARRPSRYQHVPGAFEKRLSTGEKRGVKRMAEVGAVSGALPPQVPRTPELIMGQAPDPEGRPPAARQVRAVGRWYAADITADRTATIARIFDEAARRDPAHERTWLVLVDGDRPQIMMIEREAAARGTPVTLLAGFIHVLEYLWKAGWAFHAPRDPALEAWVTAQATEILHGRTAGVIDLIKALAAEHPPRPGSEHDRQIRKTLSYLTCKLPYLDYPRALAAGWPIATGVIEGACRHLVQDRLAITGARWGLAGAEAILRLRAIKANGDLDAYWAHHTEQERQRNHLSRYQPGHQLAA
jgi:hypothetical protein